MPIVLDALSNKSAKKPAKDQDRQTGPTSLSVVPYFASARLHVNTMPMYIGTYSRRPSTSTRR